MRVYNGRQKYNQRTDAASGASATADTATDASAGTAATAGPKTTASESVSGDG